MEKNRKKKRYDREREAERGKQGVGDKEWDRRGVEGGGEGGGVEGG